MKTIDTDHPEATDPADERDHALETLTDDQLAQATGCIGNVKYNDFG